MPANVRATRDEPRPVRGDRCLTPWEAAELADERAERRRLEAEERRLNARAARLGAALRREIERETRVAR
jgi:hypothetical protein